jgi:transcriptional regulator with XRE-family HTH domain
MKKQDINNRKEGTIFEIFEKQYQEAENKEELDYWAPLTNIISESIELRDSKRMSQTDLASKMKTRQSVISRFENMGRLPNYDFFVRLAIALDHAPGMTLYGDYMAVVPFEQQAFIKGLADKNKTSTKEFVQDLLDHAINCRVFNTNYEKIVATAAEEPLYNENNELAYKHNLNFFSAVNSDLSLATTE